MAYLVQPDYVKYTCTCGQQKPITNLYFCRHCLKIRCSFCISHEVDSHYCANCLENMPSSEARLKKNRCGSCFDCPSCFHTLSTRATVAQPRQDPAAGDAKVENKQSKKMYYLLCFNCRWTSRDVGIPDQPVATGGWPERVNPFNSRVNQLLDFYKAVVQQEKQEKLDKERKKYAIRGKYITLTDKTGLTMAMARNIAGLPSSEGAPSSAIANFVPSQASAEWQPADVARLYPLARPLSVKRSQRCRLCDHNLTKPDYHVPEVKIISCETLKPGATCALLLKLSNPTAHEMQITLVDPAEVPEHQEREEGRTIEKSLEKSLCLEKDMSWLEAVSRKVDVTSPLSVTRPDVTLTLAQRDDAAEYDDDAHTHSDDVILWRKSNKLALRLQVQVAEGAVEGPGARLPLALRYSYRNTVPPASAAPLVRDHVLYVAVLLDLGQVYAE
ncbi:unnamed protein product [Leptidea sinapis]|uniref:Dynactin subunit 4 n=1 Tax=Leptidea sinapis TaxID=189913 RepID=A0A5E4Q7N8_9NEOP|nr:unnamed protein product [Leptidea sinapis]